MNGNHSELKQRNKETNRQEYHAGRTDPQGEGITYAQSAYTAIRSVVSVLEFEFEILPFITRGAVVRAYAAFYFLPAIQSEHADHVFQYRFR